MTDSHEYFDNPMTTRLLVAYTAVAGELLVTRAALRRLQYALECSGALPAGAVESVADDPEYQKWLGSEQQAYSEFVMAPLVEPNLSSRL